MPIRSERPIHRRSDKGLIASSCTGSTLERQGVAADPPSWRRARARRRATRLPSDEPFAYVINEIDSTIATYVFDAQRAR